MKKIGIFALIIAIFACFVSTHANFQHVYALENTKTYLIASNFASESDYQTKYNILSTEVYTAKPINYAENKVYSGSSIYPQAEEDSSFSKTFSTKVVDVNNEMSVFMYLFFSNQSTHDLTVEVGDGTSSLTWQLTSSYLNSILVQEYGFNIYGWVLFEFPVVAATSVGELSEINSLTLTYNSDSAQDIAKLVLFAPYVSNSLNSDVDAVEKQQYYNIGYNIGDKKYYTGDILKVEGPNSKFLYANLGSVNYLTESSTYSMYLSLVNIASNTSTEYQISNSPISFAPFVAGTYELRIVVKDADSTQIYAKTVKTFYVTQFVAFYIENGLFDMKIGDSLTYDIHSNSEVMLLKNLELSGVNSKVAKCEIVNNKLSVKAISRGNFSVTITGEYTRDGDVFETFSITYSSVSRSEAKGTNWWLFGGAAVAVVVGGIAIYIIMRHKRLIKGHYPKY